MIAAHCWNSAEELATALADEVAREAGREHPVPHAIMLAGGSTPLAAYRALTAKPPTLDPSTHILFSDDRHVPPDNPKSNYGQIRPMLDAWGIPSFAIHRVEGEKPLAAATQSYNQSLARFLDQGGVIPLGLLGLGSDGHTASLFTPEHLAQGHDACAISVARPDGLNGISVTPRLLKQVWRILFVVSGASKQAIVQQLLNTPESTTAGAAIAGHPCVELWLDRAAQPVQRPND